MEEVTAVPAGPPSFLDRLYPERLGAASTTVALIAALCVTTAAVGHANSFERTRPAALATGILHCVIAFLALFLPWSGAWSLASRVFRQEARFLPHLNIAMATVLLALWVDLLLKLAAFAFALDGSMFAPDCVTVALILAWGLGGHLRQASPLRGAFLSSIAAAVAALLIGLYAALEMLSFKTTPALKAGRTSILPPALRMARPASVETHLEALARLQVRVDALAK